MTTRGQTPRTYFYNVLVCFFIIIIIFTRLLILFFFLIRPPRFPDHAPVNRLSLDRTGRRDPAEERTATTTVWRRDQTETGKTMRVPEPGTEIVRVLPENEPAATGPDHVAR